MCGPIVILQAWGRTSLDMRIGKSETGCVYSNREVGVKVAHKEH